MTTFVHHTLKELLFFVYIGHPMWPKEAIFYTGQGTKMTFCKKTFTCSFDNNFIIILVVGNSAILEIGV